MNYGLVSSCKIHGMAQTVNIIYPEAAIVSATTAGDIFTKLKGYHQELSKLNTDGTVDTNIKFNDLIAHGHDASMISNDGNNFDAIITIYSTQGTSPKIVSFPHTLSTSEQLAQGLNWAAIKTLWYDYTKLNWSKNTETLISATFILKHTDTEGVN